jgi:hypothetical protein
MDFREIGCDDGTWIQLAQDRVIVLAVLNLRDLPQDDTPCNSQSAHKRVTKRHVLRFYSINIAEPCRCTNSNGYNIQNCPPHPTSLTCVFSLPTHWGHPPPPPHTHSRCAFVICTTQKYDKAANPNSSVQSPDSCYRALHKHLPTDKHVRAFDLVNTTFGRKCCHHLHGARIWFRRMLQLTGRTKCVTCTAGFEDLGASQQRQAVERAELATMSCIIHLQMKRFSVS